MFQTFFWLSGSISSIFFISSISGSANSKTKTWRIYIICILSKRSSSYVISPRTVIILKNNNFAKFNLLLGLVVQKNIIFVFNIFFKRYTLFSFLRVSP